MRDEPEFLEKAQDNLDNPLTLEPPIDEYPWVWVKPKFDQQPTSGGHRGPPYRNSFPPFYSAGTCLKVIDKKPQNKENF